MKALRRYSILIAVPAVLVCLVGILAVPTTDPSFPSWLIALVIFAVLGDWSSQGTPNV